MPTTLPSPTDRGEFSFVAVDSTGATWRWIDRELVWVRVDGTRSRDDKEANECGAPH